MKSLLILGAGRFQKPLIVKAREMGLDVHAAAWRQGAVGNDAAGHFHAVSVTDVNAVVKLAMRIKPDGVVSIASDAAMPAVAQTAEKLGLPGPGVDVIHNAVNKIHSRKILHYTGIPQPRFGMLSTDRDLAPVAGDLNYPLIVKPTDRSGSLGLRRVESPPELRAAFHNAALHSFEKRAIVEEFILGKEYSLEIMTAGGKHFCLAITEKETTGPPFYVESAQIQPSGLEEPTTSRLVDLAIRTLDALGIRTGASHVETIIDREGQMYVIEVGPRMGGDFIGSHLTPLATGIDYMKLVIDTALGEDAKPPAATRRRAVAVRFLFAACGVVRSIKNSLNEMPFVVESAVDVSVGDKVEEIDSSGKRLGYYIAVGESRDELLRRLEIARQGVKIQTDG